MVAVSLRHTAEKQEAIRDIAAEVAGLASTVEGIKKHLVHIAHANYR